MTVTPVQATLDHLVVTAGRLETGIAHVSECLDVELETGGRHAAMGTHNAVVSLGAGVYLEVIAIDPDMTAPEHRRWFGLDDIDPAPRLATWVARTTQLEATSAAAGYAPGTIRALARGDLTWRITVPDDGGLIENGLLPPLLEWGDGAIHPSERLPDRGCRLLALQAGHPDRARITAALAPVGLGETLRLEHGDPPWLRARIDTPRGVRVLR